MDRCECDKCTYCKGRWHDTRQGFSCDHPNQMHIIEWFRVKKIHKMPGFIGFGAKFSRVPTNKTTPKWCPKLLKEGE